MFCWEASRLVWPSVINPLNAELNPICHLLALLGAHHILHVSRIGVKTDRLTQKVTADSRSEVILMYAMMMIIQ